jgi:predicted enzyme related to lactoylglutathione lyase
MPTFSPEQPSGWSIYVGVADLQATLTRVGALGGKVVQPPVEVQGEGRFAVVADPTGGVFKLWQALK